MIEFWNENMFSMFYKCPDKFVANFLQLKTPSGVWHAERDHFPCTISWKVVTFRQCFGPGSGLPLNRCVFTWIRIRIAKKSGPVKTYPDWNTAFCGTVPTVRRMWIEIRQNLREVASKIDYYIWRSEIGPGSINSWRKKTECENLMLQFI